MSGIQSHFKAKTKFTKNGALDEEKKERQQIETGLIFNNALSRKIENVLGFTPKRYPDAEKTIILTQEFAWAALEKLEKMQGEIDALRRTQALSKAS